MDRLAGRRRREGRAGARADSVHGSRRPRCPSISMPRRSRPRRSMRSSRDLPVKITARGEKLFGDYVMSGNVLVDSVSPRKVLPSLGVELPVTADPAALSSLSYKSDYRLTEKQLQLPALELVLDETQVRGNAAIEDLEAMALRFDLSVNAINVDRYLEPEPKEGEATARRRADKAADGPAARCAARAERPRQPARRQGDALRPGVRGRAPAAGCERRPRAPGADPGPAVWRRLQRRHRARRAAGAGAPVPQREGAWHRHRRPDEGDLRHRPRRGPWRCERRADGNRQHRRRHPEVPLRQARFQREGRRARRHGRLVRAAARRGALQAHRAARASRPVRRRRPSRRSRAARPSTRACCATTTWSRTWNT